MNNENMPIEKKSAFVAVVGRPSAGKSTLVNKLCGAKVAIVSPVPQTTRNSIRGIVNKAQGQLVLVDTPGRHISEKKLNRRLIETADRAQSEADLIVYVLDASRPSGPEEKAIAESIPKNMAAEKTIAVINKIDLKNAGTQAIAAAENFLCEALCDLPPERIVKISALSGEGTEALLDMLFCLAPAGPAYYPDDFYTDQQVQFRIAEIIREKAMVRLREELPHAIYVEVADMEMRETEAGKTLWVRAFILVERESQKGMVVGKGGTMIRSIRLAALGTLKKIFDWKIDLDLRVKTARDWRQNDTILKQFT